MAESQSTRAITGRRTCMWSPTTAIVALSRSRRCVAEGCAQGEPGGKTALGPDKVGAWGHAVRWPGDVEMSADALYEMGREQSGEWGPERFSDWMDQLGLSLNDAADALGMTRRMMAHYRTGSRPIPRVVALACEGLAARRAA